MEQKCPQSSELHLKMKIYFNGWYEVPDQVIEYPMQVKNSTKEFLFTKKFDVKVPAKPPPSKQKTGTLDLLNAIKAFPKDLLQKTN